MTLTFPETTNILLFISNNYEKENREDNSKRGCLICCLSV